MSTAQKTAKAAKSAADTASNTAFEAFNFAVPGDVPASFRDFAEKSVSSARDAYAKMKTAAEDATGMVEGTLETARESALTMGTKALDAAKKNTDASFAFARDLFGVKTFAEMIELHTAYTRKAFESATAQVKEFQDLAQKFVAETTKPVTAQVEKTFSAMKAA